MGCVVGILRSQKSDDTTLMQKTLDNTSPFNFKNYSTDCKIIDVYNNHTCRGIFKYNSHYHTFKLKLADILTLKIKQDNNNHTNIVQDRLRELMLNKIVYIECGQFDKSGNINVIIYLDRTKILSVNQILIDESLAKPHENTSRVRFNSKITIFPSD